MIKGLITKIRILKKVNQIHKELKKYVKTNDATIQEAKLFLDNAKLLFPRLGGLIEGLFEIVEINCNKEV